MHAPIMLCCLVEGYPYTDYWTVCMEIKVGFILMPRLLSASARGLEERLILKEMWFIS